MLYSFSKKLFAAMLSLVLVMPALMVAGEIATSKSFADVRITPPTKIIKGKTKEAPPGPPFC